MNKNKKILIIEDNESMLLLMNHYFGKQYEVHAAKNGLEAMHWLNAGVSPDVILLDWDMPVMSGAQFLKGIKNSSFFKDIPIIIISGCDEDTVKLKVKPEVDYYFTKPFDPKELNEKIQQTVSASYF